MAALITILLTLGAANLASPLPVQVDPPCLNGTCRIVVAQATNVEAGHGRV